MLIKQIQEKLLFLSHKLLFFANFSSLLFVLSFFLLFSHHGSISKQNTHLGWTWKITVITSLIWNLNVQVRKTSVGEDWHCFGQSVQKSSSESNDCFVSSYRLSKCQSLPTTTLLRTPKDLENKIPPRYVTNGFNPFAMITVWQAILKTKWCTVIGYCLVRVLQ